MKFLILGGNGLVGKSLLQQLNHSAHEVVATFNNFVPDQNALKCNILNTVELLKVFEKVKPDVVINATNLAGGVDYCESNPELAKKFHLIANIEIGNLCTKHDAKMVLISTDYVFDGENSPYNEEDKPNPLNKYGQYKLEAEQWMQTNLENHLIVRTTNVFGWDPLTKTPNFIMGLYFKLVENQHINVPSFLSGNPTHVSCLSKAIIEIVEKGATGVFHIVGSSFINRYEWALKFCELMNFDKRLIAENPIVPKQMIPRPLNSNLSTCKFTKLFKTNLHNVDEGLKFFIAERV